jgi:hypothetical protein
MEEFLENLLFSALFPQVDRWRKSQDASCPPDEVLRVFICMEMRLQDRYGYVELGDMVQEARMRAVVASVRRRLFRTTELDFWSALTRTFPINQLNLN